MNRPPIVFLSLGLVLGLAFSTAEATPFPPEQTTPFQPTPEFTEAENIVDELSGTPASDPESQAKLQQARAVFQAAVAQSPQATLALNYLARTYSFEGQNRAVGIATFEKSLAVDPNQPDAIARLIALCLDAGQRAKAAEAQSRLVNRNANPQLATRVDKLLAQWDSKEGQRLVSEGRASEGFALLDRAIQESASDPDAQQGLRETRQRVSRGWEATLYNDALAKVKAKDYRGAWDVLEKLLPVAKDPEVVDRAKRLHDKLVPVINPGKG
jgi:tetratricopeptide (TPR) repeat protein